MMYSEKPVAIEQPVRFYKIVAITFLILTCILFGVIIFMSSKRAVVTIVTKTDPIELSTRVKIGDLDNGADIEGTATSTVVTVAKNFSPTGTKKEEGVAGGMVRLHNDSSSSQPLVATTRLLTEDGVLFRLKDRVVVPAKGSVEAEVYADEKGASGDIGPQELFTIPGLNASRQKEVYASSDDSMSGGLATIGILSEEDIRSAEKEMEAILADKGKDYFDDLGSDVIFDISNKSFEVDTEVGKEVSKFTLTGKATVVAIEYDLDELKKWSETELRDEQISDDEIVSPSESMPTVTFEEYDRKENVATVQVFADGLATLNPESPSLEKSMFFGKTKEEVRHYILPLDHVQEVDVEFSPAWVRKVPFMGEHVTVKMKEI